MRIENKTGFAGDTKIYDDEGRDVTLTLRAVKIEIAAGDLSRVQITCVASAIDVVGDLTTEA